MKKVSLFHKVVATVAILVLIISVASFVLTLQTRSYINDNLDARVRKQAGSINMLIDCAQGNKNACGTLVKQ